MLHLVQKTNPDPMLPFLIIGSIMTALGLLFVLYPSLVRKYDIRLRRFVPEEERYTALIRTLGVLLLGLGLLLAAAGGIIFVLR